MLNGKGKYVFENSEYEGDWYHSKVTFDLTKMHGMGEMRWKDGRRYVGQFKNGRRHGYG
jgi:hypothetical protein